MRADILINGVSLSILFPDLIFDIPQIGTPKAKELIIAIPGTSEVVDLTEVLTGDVEYEQRSIKFKLESKCGKKLFYSQFSKLANFIHGKKAKIILTKDPGFYYYGRLSVDSFDIKFYGGTPTISANVEAYKYERFSGNEVWEWDSFSFLDGIIRNYKDLTVDGTLVLTIPGRRKKVCPIIECSAAMTVSYLGVSYDLAVGKNMLTALFLGEDDHVLTFVGTGTISVDYRGASL